jgi:acetyl esterase
MRLHPQVSGLLVNLAEAGYGDLSSVSLETLRSVAREQYVPVGPPVYVREIHIPGPAGPLVAQVYAPTHGNGLMRGLVFFSAGFYVVGGLTGHAALCQQLAVSSDCVVISVETRLAP